MSGIRTCLSPKLCALTYILHCEISGTGSRVLYCLMLLQLSYMLYIDVQFYLTTTMKRILNAVDISEDHRSSGRRVFGLS